MKPIKIIALLGLVLVSTTYSQKLEVNFSKLAWGYNYAGLRVDPGIFNEKIPTMANVDSLGSWMNLNGIGGWISVNDRWRVGAIGMFGNILASGQSDEIDNLFRQVDLNIKFAGPTLESIFRPFKGVEFTIGGMVGFGDVGLQLYQKDGNLTWDAMWEEYTDEYEAENAVDTTSYIAKARLIDMHAKTLVIYPWVGFRIPDFLGVLTIGVEAGGLIGTVSEENWRIPFGKVANAKSFDLTNPIVRMTVYFGN
ncbi:MAG: hypothetical protein ISS00_02260 [Candidatus Marinimicrobia bacterium]|nr:hypothetical protein [Candidatus Neomarinimicrobiota bacterium]